MSTPEPAELHRRIDALVERARARCLWYLREDYYPRGDAERLAVLELLQRSGDQRTFQEAGELKRWLSRDSSETSAGS